MGIRFAKVDADLDNHPKVRRAGRNGREVFLFVLRRNASLDRSGRVPTSYIEPWYRADQLMMSEADAADGVSRIVTAGLVTLRDGHAVIAGWDDEWAKAPLDEAERKRREREKKRQGVEVDAPADLPETAPVITAPSPVESRDVTDSHGASVTDRDCPDSHALDKSRLEESRTLSVPPAAPAEGEGLFALKAKVDTATGDVGRKRAEKPATPKQPAPHQPAIEHFDARYADAYGCRPEWRAAGEAKQIADLTKRHGADEVIRRIDALFDGSAELAWLKPPFTVGTLNNNWNRLVTVSAAPRVSDRIIKDL